MKKTILLYNPSTVFYDMPLALLAIGTQVCEAYNVVIVDARMEKNPQEILERHLDDLLLVGVTSLTGAPLKDAIAFSKTVKRLKSDIPVIWGGWHTSLFPEQVLVDVEEVDVSVQGQGESTFKELVKVYEGEMGLKDVKGIVFRNLEGKVVKNPPRLMDEMNELPRVNYDLIDVERYFKAKGRRQFDIITSTGCFFRCTFCADPFVFSRKFTGQLPDRVFDDLMYYHKKYQFDDVNFQDETFFTYPKRILELAQSVKDAGKPFTWAATMRADQGSRMTKEDFRLCKEGGLRRLLIGVESGSQEMMDWLKKDIKIEHVRLCAQRCSELGINVIFPFIVGFPKETEKSIDGTKSMIRELALMSEGFETPVFYFKPYPGTQITDEVVRDGSYQLPETIQEWSDFDYIGSKGPWVSDALFKEIERYKFYLRVNRQRKAILKPLRWISRGRIKRLNFSFPIEKVIIDRIQPKKELS
ncbi:B12-binding domain-containing radical SAM protein [Crocinitomicaceae bacterium]|nr:B12-binding domain-containing radical SAM protein [Crocinitomicaceae bacterium]